MLRDYLGPWHTLQVPVEVPPDQSLMRATGLPDNATTRFPASGRKAAALGSQRIETDRRRRSTNTKHLYRSRGILVRAL